MSYLSVYLFVAFASGIAAGKFFSLNSFFLIFFAGFCLLLAVVFYKRRKLVFSDLATLFLFFFLGLIWINPYTAILPGEFLKDEVSVYGRIDRPAKEFNNFRTYAAGSNYVIRGNEKIYYPGAILVKDHSQQEISYLDFYLLRGKLRKSGYGNSKYTLYLSGNNPPSLVKRSTGIRKLAFVVSEQLATIIESNFSGEVTPFILSIFLGKREELSRDIRDIFAGAGTSHILAISGLHTGMVAGIFLFILKIAGFKRRPRYVAAALIVAGYAFLCGLKTPVVRASIMFACWSLSLLLRRRSSVFNLLALAGLINLLIRPVDLFSVSFQLSYIAVFSIALGFRYVYPLGLRAGFGQKVKVLFFSSVFANLGLLPLVSLYWGKIYILNIFTNVIVIPYLGLIISGLFVFLGFSFIYPFRVFLSASCEILVLSFLKLNHLFSQIPFSYLGYEFSPGLVAVYYSLLILLLVIGKKIPRPY